MSAGRGGSLSGRIAAGLALGVLVGMAAGPAAGPLGELGKLVIQLIKAAAAPLLFLAIVNAVLKTEVKARSAARMAAVACFNATIALLLGLALSNLLKPGLHLQAQAVPAGVKATAKLSFDKFMDGLIPTSFAGPFVENAVIQLVVLALLLGFGLRRARAEKADGAAALEELAAGALRVTEVALGWIIQLVPLAVFGVVAKAVGQYGFGPLKGLGVYVGVGLLGLALHSLIVYQLWLVLYAKIGLARFWRIAKDPVVYAAGANSSLATLPVTLTALDKLGVSRSSATLGACVGTNLNNDGIILYEAMAVLFVAQAHGLELSLSQQIFAALSCIVAAIGIAGVPEAGFVSLSLVLATCGLPTELLPLLLTVDWIVARGRSIVNVLSDMLVSIILDRWDGRDLSRAPSGARLERVGA